MPYMTMANSSAAATNQKTRPVVWYLAPRSAEAPISIANCNAVMARAATRLPRTMEERLIGATRSSRMAPCWRSTMTPMPENMQLSGISRPAVASAMNVI